MMRSPMIPVVTIDGPSGTGKGTIADLVATQLGWHCLDSGALYRVLGLAAGRRDVGLEDVQALEDLASNLDLKFEDARVYLDGKDVSEQIRSEEAGNAASKVAAHGVVRERLLDWQRSAARAPGLVADGRDMGTVVFPEAPVKIFLTASPAERAQRRYKQLKDKGLDVSLSSLVNEIRDRDERDRSRSVAPLRAPDRAFVVDTTSLTIAQVLDRVLAAVKRVLPDVTD